MSEAEPGLTGARWTGLVRRPDYDEYSVKYQDFFAMRRQDGIIELRMHRDGGPYGLVNEVLPRDRLLGRAWELAEMIMRRPPGARRVTHAIASRPWKQRVASDFSSQLYGQGYALFTDADRAGEVPPAGENLSEFPF